MVWRFIFFIFLFAGHGVGVFAQAGLELGGIEERHCDQYTSSYMFVLENKSDASLFQENSYEIDFGDGRVLTSQSHAQISGLVHTYSEYGTYRLRFSARSKATGAVVTREYTILNIGIPSLGLGDEKMVISCTGSNAVLWATDFEHNAPGTKYTVSFGDRTQTEIFTQQQLVDKKGGISHKYVSSHCKVDKEGFVYEIQAKNECDYTNSKMGRYKVVVPPIAKFECEEPVCINSFLRITNKSIPGQNAECTETTKYEWYVDGQYRGTGITPNIVFTEKGPHTVKLVASNGPACSQDSYEKTIEVFDEVTVGYQISESVICVGENLSLTSLATGYLDHTWIITYPDGHTREWKDKDVSLSFSECGVYNIQLYVEGKCTPLSKDTTLIVKKDPEVSLDKFDTLCPGQVVNFYNNVRYAWNCNAPTADWEITTPSRKVEKITNNPYPSYTFKESGKYLVKVIVQGADCPQKEIVRQQEVNVHDLTFVKDITASVSDICEGQTVKFTSNSSASHLTYQWNVPFESRATPVAPTTFRSPSPEILFPKWGTYQVVAHLSAVCGLTWEKTFPVKVKSDPEVRFGLVDKYCPGELDMGVENRVMYQWKDNPEKVRWEVTPLDGSPANGCVLGNASALYPKIQLNAAGKYELKVTIDPVGCQENSPIVRKKTITVYNDSKTMKISIDSLVCVGELVEFRNESVVAEEDIVTYNWTILPSSGWKYEVGDATASGPTVVFSEDGYYEVTASVKTCDELQETFQVHAKKNPEVKLKETHSFCPGKQDLADFVEYTWFHNRKDAVWEIKGVHTYVDGTNANDLYPHVNFGAGEIQLGVRVEDVNLKCGDLDKALAMETYHVYDSSLQIKIEPDRLDLCVGETLAFTNTTTSGEPGVTYEWSVAEADGYEFTGGEGAKSLAAPEIRFTKFGTYHIGVTIRSVNECNVKKRQFEIIVRDVPRVTFHKLENECKGVELGFTPEKIEYVRNNCDLTYAWNVTPSTGWSIDHADSKYPKITFDASGQYEIEVKVTGQCGGERKYARKMTVLDTHLEAIASPDIEEACTPLRVQFRNTSVGDSLEYLWRIEPLNGYEYEAPYSDTSLAPAVLFSEAGNYRVVLKISNICAWDTTSFYIRSYSTPVILPPLQDITNVCEKDYVFIGRDELSVDDKNDEIIRVEWTVNPPSGFRYVNGTGDTSRYPEMVFEHGSYRLEGRYWNHCQNEGTVTLNIVTDEFIPVEPLSDDTVCSRTEPFILTAEPAGGEWSSVDRMLKEIDGEVYFDPYLDAERDYEVVYTYRNGSCVDRDTMNVHTIALPVVVAGDDQEICINEEGRLLVAVEPVTGGWWEGQGITGDEKNYFMPDVVGARPLRYLYTDEVTGCTNRDTLIMTVWGLPGTDFQAERQYCVFADALFQPEEKGVRNRFHWEFGDNTETVSWGDTVHRYQQPGFVDVRLITESVHGCWDTSGYQTVEIVNIPPDAKFELSDTSGCGPFDLQIEVDESQYTDHNLLFKWDFGNGLTSTDLLPPPVLTYQAGVWDTAYTIRFDVYNQACEHHRPLEKMITVYSSPAARFVKQHEWECAPIEVRFQNLSTGNRNRYEWYYGDDSVSYKKEGVHLFHGDTVTRVYRITLIAINNCGRDSFVDSLTVRPQSIHAFFQTPERDICVGEEICFTNYTTEDLEYMVTQQWDFGDGSLDTTWDACHSYRKDGTFKVHLYVNNGCGFDTISDYLRIYPLPSLSIRSENELCENDTFHFELKSDLPLQRQEWDFGDTTSSLFRQDVHRYAGYGKRLVKVWALSSSPAVCRGETEKEVIIHPLPVITILPLDTAACAPFYYEPSVSGEGHLMWDYGDGTELTSAVKHEYVNETDEVLYHPVHVYAESNKGCKSEYEGEVIVYNVPRVGLDKKIITLGKPQVVEYINHSEMYDECIWYLPFDKIVHSFDNQQVEFEETELYTTSLVAVNRYGCRDSVAIEHQVVMKGLFFPNSFLPSSANPQVNRFNGKGIGLKSYHLVIYDQYGNRVWETRELANGHPSEGWDGRGKNGEMLPQGAYIWRAEATFIDDTRWTGKNSDSGATQTVQGVVLMLKNN